MGERINVAIVDDHTLLRDGLKEILIRDKEERFHVTGTYSNGKDFIDALTEIKCDVVILDIQMPVKGGESTLEHLKAFHPNIHPLMISSLDQDYQVGICVRLGAKGFLPKHVGQFEFAKAILTVCKGGYYFNSLLTTEKLEDYLSRKKSPETLSFQECKIIQLVAEGLSTDEIAERLHLSRNTIKTYRERALKKTGTSNSLELYHFAVQHGFIKHYPK